MDLELAGKKALVTAASKGLGKAAAEALAHEGAQVAICARSDQIHRVAKEISRDSGGPVHAYNTDLTRPKDIEKFVKSALEDLGGVDILIINSGGPPPGTFMDFTPDDWRSAVELTLMSAVELCYQVVPIMVQQNGGSIVTSQSVSVKQPVENLILSNSIRLAVIGLMKSLANELGPSGIRVNSINPTFTWTERVASLMEDRASRSDTTVEDVTARTTQEIPLRRMGSVEEFGRAIAWLASPAASYIHGYALMFDGGAVKFPL